MAQQQVVPVLPSSLLDHIPVAGTVKPDGSIAWHVFDEAPTIAESMRRLREYRTVRRHRTRFRGPLNGDDFDIQDGDRLVVYWEQHQTPGMQAKASG
jgi:hypothetical protein